MAGAPNPSQMSDNRAGLLSGLTAYMIWGLFPIYFVATKHVPALEILAHRILWSVPFGFLILLFRKQIAETLKAIVKPRTFGLLTIAAIALAANWGVYIWAIQLEQIFQGSLGYYINPLLYVLVGVVFFKEKLSKLQAVAILFAFLGVMILTIQGGQFPGISLFLAVSFTTYGVMRKQIDIGAMPGLFIETLVLLLPAIIVLSVFYQNGTLAWNTYGREMDFLLILAGPLTVLPLLAFAFAARRIPLSTLGILQYIGPTMQFGCAIYYGEKFTTAHAWCFGLIWLGVGVFAYDAIRKSRQPSPVASQTENQQTGPRPDSR
jgi:chloramphenicol-sensitive protein RarD